jgi:hypothetical protein
MFAQQEAKKTEAVDGSFSNIPCIWTYASNASYMK